MKNWFNNFFKLSNWKRWLIVTLTLLLVVLTIGLVTPFYLNDNVKTNSELTGGNEVIVQIQDPLTLKPADNDLTDEVSQNIYNRLGGQGKTSVSVTNEGNGFIKIVRANESIQQNTSNNLSDLITDINDKTNFTFTDTNGASLFVNNGSYNNSIENSSPVNSSSDFETLNPPFKENSATFTNNSVRVELTETGKSAWSLATQYISTKKDDKNTQLNQRIAMWLNLDKLLEKYQDTTEFDVNAKRNPYNFVFEKETPSSTAKLKTSPFEAKDFLISNQAITSRQSNASSITINGNFTRSQAAQIAAEINYTTATNYVIKQISSNIINSPLDNNSFNPILIATLVILALIALIMIVNYGILGIIQTISSALFLFLSIMILTGLNKLITPGTIAGLIVGLGILTSSSVTTFDNLKQEVYEGDGIQKAVKKTFKTSWFGIFDTQIILIIMGILTFYIGSISTQEVTLMLLIGFAFILFIVLVFNRIISTLLIRTNKFDNKLYLFGLRKKYIDQEEYVSSFYTKNYLKYSKWIIFSVITFIVIGLIVLGTLSNVFGSISTAFNASSNFSGGSTLNFENGSLSLEQANQIKQVLINNNFSSNDINVINLGTDSLPNYAVFLNVNFLISQETIDLIQTSVNPIAKVTGNLFNFSIQNSLDKLIVAIYSIFSGLAFISIYVAFRYKWTASLSLLITLILDSLLMLSIFIILRLEFSLVFITSWISILFYSLNEKMNLIIRYRNIFKLNSGEKQTKELIEKNLNLSVGLNFKKSLISLFVFISIISIMLIFTKNVFFVQNISMFLGAISSFLTTIFVLNWLIYKFEILRINKQQKRIDKDYWNTNIVEEQTFIGINNYEP